MSSVDDRIVNMQFNNKQFESGAIQSKKTLAGLETAVGRAGQSKGMTALGSAAQGVGKKFSIMQIAGVTAVATIANKAVNAGLSLVKSLTLDPIIAGWNEYNTNLKSIQTVMANTGKGIKPVQAALQQLNNYSDQTIYNFSEMAKNVGTFSAAGVKLNTSVSAIKGIANMAALSGSTSQQASTAMYQLSQAIAAGRVNLQDWNSVVNAGMGGKNLQSALIKTGIAMGKLDGKTVKWGDSIKIAGESFRTSISAKSGAEPWLGSDVLVKALALMDGRLSITAQKAKLLAANLKLPQKEQLTGTEITKKANAELDKQQKLMHKQGFTPEQIKSLTDMGEAAYNSATKVKTLPQLIGVVQESMGSIWATAFSGIVGNFTESTAIWTKAGAAIQKITIGMNLGITNFISGWKTGIDGIDGRKAVFQGLKLVFVNLGKIFKTVGQAFRDVFPPGGTNIAAVISVAFIRLMHALTPTEGTLKSLRSIFGGIFAVLHVGISIVTGIAAGFGALFGALFQGSGKAGGGILALLGSVGEMLKGLDKMLTEGGKMKDFFTTIGTVVGTALHPIVAIISNVVAALGSLGGVGGGPVAFFESISSSVGGLAINGDKITGVFKSIADAFASFDPSKMQASFNAFGAMAGTLASESVKIAGSLISGLASGLASAAPAIFAALGRLGSSIIEAVKSALGVASPSYKMIPVGAALIAGLAIGIWNGLKQLPGMIGGAIGAFFTGFANLFKNLFSGMNSLDIASMFNALLTGGLLLSLTKVSNTVLDFKKIINDVVGGLTKSLSAMQQGVKAYAIKQIAIGVALLAGSVIALSFIDPKKIAISIGAISLLVGILVGAIAALGKLSKGDVNLALIGATMTMIAGSLLTLAGAVAILGNMDVNTLIKGITALAFIMGIVAGGLAAVGTAAKISLGAGPAILAMAIAINIMTLAVATLGNMDMGTLAKGLGAMAIGMGLMVGALMILSSGSMVKQLAGSGAAMIMVATSMAILAGVVALFGNMDMGTLVKGFGAVGLALILFTGSLLLLGGAGPFVILAAASMVMMSKAMLMLVPVIAILGSMDWGTLAKGIGALALILGVVALALTAFGIIGMTVGPGLLILGAALALAGVGMLAFGTGFALLAAAGTAGVAVLSAAFIAIIALLPALATQIAAALTAMIETFAKAAPRWRTAMGTIIKNMLGAIKDAVPQLAKLLTTMALAGIAVLKKVVPKFVEMGFTIIDKFLKSVAAHIGGITKSAVDIVVNFMKAIGSKAAVLADAGAKMIIKFIEATAKAIDNNSEKMGRAAGKLGVAIIKGIVKGISGLAHEVWDAAKHLAEEAIQKIKDKLKIFSPSKVTEQFGQYFAMGLAIGINSGQKPVGKASDALAGAAIDSIESSLEIASPSKKAVWWGEQIGRGLALGLLARTKPAVMAALNLVNSVIAAGDSTVLARDRTATLAEAKAAKSAVLADLAKKKAAAIPKANKAAKKAATAASTRAAKKARVAAAAATRANTALTNAITFRDADAKGRGDIYQAAATANADKAAKLLAKAAQESATAKAYAGKNNVLAARLRAQAKADAAAAKKYANDARTQQNAALAYYAVEVNARIKTMQDTAAAEEKAKVDLAELNAATDPQAKADILTKRAEAHEKEAAAQKAIMEGLIASAQAMASKNAIAAMKLLDQADTAAAAAKQAADDAASERSAAEQALGTDSTAGGVGNIEPSRSVLEDAARVVDSYSASMAAAQEAAKADQPVLQFTQNNTSPEALSVSEIYRQTNNLMSAATVKIGAKPPGSN